MIFWTVHLLVIFGLLFWFRTTGALSRYYWAGAVFKILSGVVLGYIYLIYLKSGDTYGFHLKATALQQLALPDYLSNLFTAHYPVFTAESRNDLFIKAVSILYRITGGCYWLAGMYLSCLSFAASWYLVEMIQKYFPKMTVPAIIAFIFWPSAVLWSSGVFKDTLINTAIYLIFSIAIIYQSDQKTSWRQILLLTLCMAVLFYLKFYLFAVAGLCLGILAGWQMLSAFKFTRTNTFLLFAMFLCLLTFLASRVNRNLNFNQLPHAVVANYEQIQRQSVTPDFEFEGLSPTYWDIALQLPHSLFIGLVRPLPWEANYFNFIFSLENLTLLLLSLYTFWRFRSISQHRLVIISAVFICILAASLPLVSPNFGSLIRYRAAYTSLLAMLLLTVPYLRYFSKDQPFT